ncbi:angiogenic factor with G patch and FHA domains 1 isoform X1 [Musca domestica]|uniref:Angiogenic factor with G patch and FHA domains 1 isoform X1 n=1 Tax=Musca domestica TaxID=7370 RepID=A0A1I8N5H9_MUSDO|nr:angiogenic factor with G patch and FHA domains 1 isoform X1 [Musca domestica]
MPNSESENTDNGEKSSKLKKFRSKNMDDLKTMQREELCAYIESLHGVLKQQEKKLKKYKEKLRKLEAKINISKEDKEDNQSPDNPQATANSNEKKETDDLSAVDAFSFVDEMRQAAQNAQNINNFIYEPTSGLYYDQKSGYYYNAEYGLYYDGNTGCYYSFNQQKNCYEFHSQVQVQASKTTNDTNNDAYLEKHENQADDDIDEVVFDEFGVVTDREKLKKLREEKERTEKSRKHKKKSTKDEDKEDKHSKKHKTSHKSRKRSKRDSTEPHSDSDGEKGKKSRTTPKDMEDGELSSNSSSSSASSQSDSEEDERQKVKIFKSAGRFQDIAKKYPPSLRIIVQESNLEGLKVGSLSLITYKGGSLGREGNHDVIIPDVNVSKFHLKFTYEHKKGIYKCVDLGSRNGTILNGTRMSASKTESESHDLVHGSVLQIGQTKLLCHIHEGNSTCGLCEPGLLIEATREVSAGPTLSHKEQLKKLQRKYGLENEKFTEGQQNASSSSYQDRAATRRLNVGSSSDKEKTQTASVDTAISSENKGFKMLSKLGWNKGETLGKSQAGGLLEPINVEANAGTKGLGCDDPTAGISLNSSAKKKFELMQKTKERYQKADIFSISDDSN